MSIKEMKEQLITSIQKASEPELKSLLRLYSIAQSQKDSSKEEWELLGEQNKNKIKKGLEQLKKGEGENASKIVSQLNKKYGV